MSSTRKSELTQDILKELIHYDPDTGIFNWKERDIRWFGNKQAHSRWNKRYTNTESGHILSIRNKNYRYIRINYKAYLAHRLAFFYMTGEWPTEIDHDDQDSLNNKWENLKEVSHQQNSKNRTLRINNKTGVNGVSFCNTTNKYIAHIVDETGHHKTLGRSPDIHEMISLRKKAETKYNYHPNHGRDKICQAR